MSFRTTILLVLYAMLSACVAETEPEPHADHVFVGGAIYTVDPDLPWVDAVAISGGEIIFTGSRSDVEAYVGPETTITGLEGRLLLPGFPESLMPLLGSWQQQAGGSQERALEQLIEVYATNADRLMNAGHRAGRIKPGFRADLVVLDRNLFEISAAQFSQARVLLTMIGGEISHQYESESE